LSDIDPDELRLLAERLLTLAETKASLLQSSASERPSFPVIADAVLADVAASELKRRASRSQYLPADLFGEGGWAILLDLFVSERKGRPISVSSACIASQVPATTALRYIAALIEYGLVERTDNQADRRVRLLSLTTHGRNATRAALEEYSR
jgi:DNA-binding MarR family transcriptional regulator